MLKPGVAVSLLAFCLSAYGQAAGTPDDASRDQPMTTLKVATRVVAISAVVRGRNGEPLGGLTKDDFMLRQDGQEEPIRYFSQGSELPLTLALLVDTSGSQRTFLGDESLASDIFFETMLQHPGDRAMLVQFDTSVLQLKSLTGSANALHLALLGLSSHAATAAGTLLHDSVWAVSREVLSREQGRKAIVILSDGGDNGSRHSLAEAVEQAQRADVQVYSIVYSLAGMASGRSGARAGLPDPGQATLQRLSETTGGRVFTVSPGLGLREIFARIGEDLRLQYELGYTPPLDLPPNTYHKLDLRMKDKKLQVQARKGFFAQP